jgi:hypothetical protein
VYAAMYKIVKYGKASESGNVGRILLKMEMGNKKMEISRC